MSYKKNGRKFYYTYLDSVTREPIPFFRDAPIVASIDASKEGSKNFTSFETYIELQEFIQKTRADDRNFYEFRRAGKPFKPYFDIDFKLTKEKQTFPPDLLNNVVYVIKVTFIGFFNISLTDEQIYIYSSSTDEKLSYHIVLPDFYMNDISIMKLFAIVVDKELVNKYKWGTTGFNLPPKTVDPAVYGSSGHFRLLYCRKKGKNNIKKPYSLQQDIKSLKRSMITYIDNAMTLLDTYDVDYRGLDLDEEEEIEEACKEVFGDVKEVEDNIVFILENLAEYRADNYDDWRDISFILHNEGYPFELFDNFSKRSSKYDENAVRRHWNSLKIQPLIKFASLLYKLKIDNPAAFQRFQKTKKDKGTVITKLFEDFLDVNKTPIPNLEYITFEERYIDPTRYQVDKDILVQSYLGTGKTEALARLPQFSDKTKKILILTNRRKLAKEFSKRFKGGEKNINSYLDYNPRKHTSDFFNRIIIQPESFWRIPKDLEYDLLVIDEVESVFTQFNSSTMKTRDLEKEHIFSSLDDNSIFDRHAEFAYRWNRITKTAGKILLCDAFLSQRTIRTYNDLGRSGVLLQNTYVPSPRKAIRIPIQMDGKKESINPLIEKAVDELKKGKNIFIVVSSCKKLDDFVNAFRPHGFVGKEYSSRINAGKLLNFDCKEEWKACQYVIITTTITTGVNFDLDHFDSVFVYFQSTPLVRDLFQSIMRVRRLKEDVLYYSVSTYVFGDKFKSSPSVEEIKKQILLKSEFVNDHFTGVKIDKIESLTTIAAYNTFERNCQSETFTYENIISIFFKKCNYIMEGNKAIVEASINDIYELPPELEFFDEAFERVKNICNAEISLIQERIDNGTDTILDREILRMDTIMKRFSIDRKSPLLDELWPFVYSHICGNPEIRAQLYRTDRFFFGDWNDHSKNMSLDVTNPEIASLAKLYVYGHIYNELKLTHDPTVAEILTKGTVEKFNPVELRGWAVHYFKLKDQKKINGKMVYVNPKDVTPADNYRYVKHIFESFSGAKLSVQKPKKVKKINGKNVDVTPYELNYPALIKSIFQLKTGGTQTARPMPEQVSSFFDAFFTADTVTEF